MAKRRTRTSPQGIDRGTPETAAKRYPGTMERLIDRKTIGAEEVRAADEIQAVWRAVCAGLFARPMPMGGGSRGGKSEMADWLADAHSGRYMPWARACQGSGHVEVCIAVLIDGRSARQLDADHRRRNGMSQKMLITALRRYAAMAGWVTGDARIEWSL